jgi:hypothetical protein
VVHSSRFHFSNIGRDFASAPKYGNYVDVKTTQYFEHIRKRPDRSGILDEWIVRATDLPVRTEVQSDGRIRKWAWIPEEGKFLRVILLEDGTTVHNAFFDRSFKETRE